MIVGQDHGCRVQLQCPLDHLAREHRRLGQRAGKQLVGTDQPVLRIQKDHHEHFPGQPPQRDAQVLLHDLGAVDQDAVLHLFHQHPPGQFDHHGQRRGPGRPQTIHAHQLLRFGGQQPRQRGATVGQQLLGQRHGRLTPVARSQQNGQQLGVRQRRRTMPQQPLAWALPFRPVAQRTRIGQLQGLWCGRYFHGPGADCAPDERQRGLGQPVRAGPRAEGATIGQPLRARGRMLPGGGMLGGRMLGGRMLGGGVPEGSMLGHGMPVGGIPGAAGRQDVFPHTVPHFSAFRMTRPQVGHCATPAFVPYNRASWRAGHGGAAFSCHLPGTMARNPCPIPLQFHHLVL